MLEIEAMGGELEHVAKELLHTMSHGGHLGWFCQIQNNSRQRLSLQLVSGHGKSVREWKLASL